MNYKNFQFFLFFLSSIVWAQDPFYINYSIKEGFPSSTVYSVNTDKKGYLWFTTDVGVVKYDSNHFELLNTDNGLSDNEVFQMITDFKGRSWLLTLSGKLSFIYKEKIYNDSNSSLIQKVSGSGIASDLYEDENNNIYIIYRNREISIIKSDNSVEKKTNFLSQYGAWKKNKTLYIANNGGVFNTNTRKFVFPFNKQNVFKVHHSSNADFISCSGNFYKIENDEKFKKIIDLPFETEILNSFIENENKIWITTRNGLFLIENNIIKNHYFNNYTITSITKDFENGYWLSTLKNGVIYVPNFNIYLNKLNESSEVKLNCISISKKNEIWVGGDNNSYYIKKPNSVFTKHKTFPEKRNDLISNIRFFNNETYIIGKVGILKIDSNKGKTDMKFSANDILIHENDYFVGYNYTYKIPKKKISNTNASFSASKIILEKRSNIFSKGLNNDIWIGSTYGLYKYTANDQITFYGDKFKQLQSPIENLYFDHQNNSLIVATGTKGLIIIKNDKILSHFTNLNGLNSNCCNAIKKISPNFYLIATNKGLNSINYTKNYFELKNLNALLGIKNNKINDINYLENIVYLATDNGLMSFNLNNLLTKKNKPICQILKINAKTFDQSKSYHFKHNQNEISIEYVGISYTNQGNLTYYYKLNDQINWSSSNETKINYKSLSSGKYTFKIFAINSFGEKSSVSNLTFEIQPPFWQKTWFIIILLITISYLVYYFSRYYIKKQQIKFEKENEKIRIELEKTNLEKQMIELEQKALRMQMNPHFIFNALNTIKGYYSEDNDEKAGNYISKFSTLLRMLLENTEQTIPLSTEIKMLELYIDLTKIRYKNSFEYCIEVDQEIKPDDVAIPTLLLQPIVENAIIHGLAPKKVNGLLQISFLKKENYLVCIVKDNGIGRKAALEKQKHKQHESKAIEITKDRLKLLENENNLKSEIIFEDLYDNNIGIGTIVTIKIPFKTIW